MMTMILKSELKYQNFVIKDKFENFLQYCIYQRWEQILDNWSTEKR